MASIVEFKFDSFQQVRIAAIDVAGFVFSRMNNAEGRNEYKVSFWMDGKKNDGWFYEFELTEAA